MSSAGGQTISRQRVTKKQEQAQRIRNAIQQLQDMIQPGDTISTVLKSRAKSGMYRHIAVIVKDRNISGLVSSAVDSRWHDDDSVGMSGCGMDIGFAVVYALSDALFPQGFVCVGNRCPSNDHSNGDRDYTPHHHISGGYALRQRWL
ncbi:MAG TPA: hypothetical protein DCP69_04545 [Candidatus Omnitrophica bacterium]|nr:hypothetical protein [Candidatus Omnitrophota bacterium]